MASKKKTAATKAGDGKRSEKLPAPFKPLSPALSSFTTSLSKKHIYVTHIDPKPRGFKFKIFLVPVAMNLAVVLLFVWRMNYVLPWYGSLLLSTLGYTADTPALNTQSSTPGLLSVILRRAFTFLLDFLLVVFVWPWPVEFCLAKTHGNPVYWRLKVGFRDKEIYVRRSRTEWDSGVLEDVFEPSRSRLLLSKTTAATDLMLLREKTGYLTMNADWDLDWMAMVAAHKLVDSKEVAVDAFSSVVLFWTKDFGWVCVDRATGGQVDPNEDKRRQQVFAFRDALSAIGKEDLFFRWIEIVQFESSQPGGFGPEKQVEVAQKIRELFSKEGIDFDEFWMRAVGSQGLAGMS
jgi:hypothetical protein